MNDLLTGSVLLLVSKFVQMLMSIYSF